jgi:RHS repeat-associated protein
VSGQPVGDLLTLPSGGGALRGLGESFQPDLHTGTGRCAVPLELPPGRAGFQPALALAYDSAGGNGPCGIGWTIDVPAVRRRTDRRVPRYDGTDVFVLSGAEELVPVPGAAPPAQRFRPRAEGSFSRIERRRDDTSDTWEVWSAAGLRSRYGTRRPEAAEAGWTDPAVIADPAAPGRIASWLLTETRDLCGNRITYRYVADPAGPQRLLSEIGYAERAGGPESGFLTLIRLRYAPRPDVFTSRRTGFALTTSLRCVAIETWLGGPEPALVRRFSLRYADDLGRPAANGASLLARVEVTGHDGDDTQALPPLELTYADWAPDRVRPLTLRAPDDVLPERSLAADGTELVDLFADGLPSIVQLGDDPRYWRNRGDGQLDGPRRMAYVPDGAVPRGQWADLDGDGRLDLLVQDGARAGYFPLGGDGGFDRKGFARYDAAPAVDLADPQVRLVDLDGDNVVDLVRGGERLEQWLNTGRAGWRQGPAAPSPGVSFDDPRVRLADMTGDQLADIVVVGPRRVRYWPNLGNGRWGAPVDMANAPPLGGAGGDGLGFDPRRVLVGDVDGDGCAELIELGDGHVTVWPNLCGTGFGVPRTVRGTPEVTDPAAVRLADMLGTGTAGLLFTRDLGTGRGSTWWFLDLVRAGKPYLLTGIDNHCGAHTTISYAPSTRFALADARAGRPWRAPIPFPVQVVTGITATEHFSQSRVDAEYRYRDGYWDSTRREFRGFARVDQRDLRPGAGGRGSPPTETRTWFHIGPVGPVDGDWRELDAADEHWPGDPSGPVADLTALGPGAPRAVRWEASRVLAGRVLRTELYGLDGDAASGRPYTVTECHYAVAPVLDGRTVTDPGWAAAPVLAAHAVAERTTQWERGTEPMTAWTLSGAHDAYGRPGFDLAVALPRGGVAAGEPCLTTLTRHRWATRDDDTAYVIDRPARAARWEVLDDGRTPLAGVVAGALGRSLPRRLLSLELRRYDGLPFLGLPPGQLGEHALLVRTEHIALTDERLAEIMAGAGPAPGYLAAAAMSWPAPYPEGFRAALAAGAGYLRYDGDDDHEPGWYVQVDRRRYDVHDDPSGRGLPVVERDARGNDTQVTYDADALLPVRVTDALGLVRSAVHDPRTRLPQEVVDANGNRTQAAYTPLGLLAWSARLGRNGEEQGDTPEQPGVAYEYGLTAWDESPAEARQPMWVHVTRRIRHRWDALREARAERAAAGAPAPGDDEVFGPQERDDHPERFAREQHAFDGAGRPLQVRTQFDDSIADGALDTDVEVAPGVASAAPAPDAVVVSGWIEYDDKGRVTRRWARFLGQGWRFGQPTAAQLASLRWTVTRYDARGETVAVRRSNGAERSVVHGVPSALDDPARHAPTAWEAYTYDENDNAGRTHPDASADWNSHWNTPSSTTVDARGRTVRTVERLEGREVVTTARHDGDGRVVEVTDPLGRARVRTTFDLLGRPWRSEWLDAGVSVSILDAGGDTVERRDARDTLVLTAYDAGRRAVRRWARDRGDGSVTLREVVVHGDAPESGLSADAAAARNLLGRPYRVLDEAGLLGTLRYDLDGNLLEKERRVLATEVLTARLPSGAGDWERTALALDWTPPAGHELLAAAEGLLEADGHVMSAAFDALGRRTRITLPVDADGRHRELRFAYARSGTLSAVTLDGEPIVERIWHDAEDRRVLVRLGCGVMTRYAYEPGTGRLARVHSQRATAGAGPGWQPTGPVLEDRGYAYDLVGNVLKLRDRTPGSGLPVGPADTLDRTFTHDPLYRLVQATGREHDLPPAEPWSGEPRSVDLTRVRAYTETYEHDDAGNVMRLRHAAGGGATVRAFTLDPGSDRVASADFAGFGQTYAFDPAGNLVGEGPARRLEWDVFGRLATFRTQLGGEPSRYAQYRYDAGGHRVLKLIRDQGGALRTTLDLDGLFERLTIHTPTGATLHDRIAVGEGTTRIAEQRAGAPAPDDPAPPRTYSLGDHLGSVHATLDDAGQVLVREEYTPFGETSFGGARFKRFRFMGCRRDEESGLALHELRLYAPWLCRWVSCDPAGDADGGGPYTFARGSPMSRADPNGAESKPAVDQIPMGPSEYTPSDMAQLVTQFRAATTWSERLSLLNQGSTLWLRPDHVSPDYQRAPPSQTMSVAAAYALGFGYHTSHWLAGQDVAEGSVWAEKGQNAMALVSLAARGLQAVKMLGEVNEAGAPLRAWAEAWDARRATFLKATDEAATATGGSNALGRKGMDLARRLMPPGMASEVNVGNSRRMDFADPLGGPGMEWEVKLSKPQNMSSSKFVGSQVTRDATRAGTYGANREVGWLSWKGMPANRTQQLEAAGVVVTDAPALASELRQPNQSLVQGFLDFLRRGP